MVMCGRFLLPREKNQQGRILTVHPLEGLASAGLSSKVHALEGVVIAPVQDGSHGVVLGAVCQ